MIKFLVPFLAVFIGYGIAFINKTQDRINTKLLLSFSGAFLLALTLFEMLPEVYSHMPMKFAGIFIMLGILLQLVLELFSKGAEHGHVHMHQEASLFPWMLFISLCIHSFLEGFAINDHNDMVYGILIHNIPIATILTLFFFRSKYSQITIAMAIFFFAIMTPLGTFIATNTAFAEPYLQYMNAIVIGIFFHISTTILFESSDGHKFNLQKFTAIIAGFISAYFL